MRTVQLIAVLLCALAGAGAFSWIAWNRRLKHVWPKRNEIKIINKGGFLPGVIEVVFQTKVIANRPVAGILHLVVFYGFVSFGAKSVTHALNGLLGLDHPIGLGPLDYVIDVFSVLVLTGVIGLAIRRYTVMKDRLTHMLESGIVLGLIATLMITYILERPWGADLGIVGVGAKANWWVHYLVLCGFPSLIAYGKHFHLLMGPVNVVLKHMVEVPSDRPIPGADLDMGGEDLDEDAADALFESELKRVGMPNGVSDFSFHTLFDPAACIECGRCYIACEDTSHQSIAKLTEQDGARRYEVIEDECVGCNLCQITCPVENCITMVPQETGKPFLAWDDDPRNPFRVAS